MNDKHKPFGAFAPNAMQATLIDLAKKSRLKRGAFRPMMSRLVNLFGATPLDIVYQGAPFRLHHQNSATERGALFNPDYNIEELNFLRAHTPAGGTFIDIGANVGTYAMVMAQHVGKHGRVVAIEPHPVTHAWLEFNATASGLDIITLVAAAVGDIDGELMIETDGDNLGASHISTTGHRVPAWTFHSILQQSGISRIDSLKIDIEGYEDRALIGFFRDAPASLWPRAIAIEHLERSEWLTDCIDIMIQNGYRINGTTRSNTLLRAFSSEVDTGSREENASKQKDRARS
jgi:FkbM family methyltransferase